MARSVKSTVSQVTMPVPEILYNALLAHLNVCGPCRSNPGGLCHDREGLEARWLSVELRNGGR